jgi:hypothetical protein
MPNYFLQMLQQLRQHEEVMLYNNLLEVSETDANEALNFLAYEYRVEARNYPFLAPDFEPEAALWAAKTIYTAMQLMLYRKNESSDLAQLLPKYEAEINPSAILSADLTLRFLPDVLTQLHLIDFEDSLLTLLKEILQTWHYAGVGYALDESILDFSPILSNPCLYQLYLDRIIEKKKISLAQNPVFITGINANLGIFGDEFWKDFKQNDHKK